MMQAMPTFSPLAPNIGVVASGVDLAQPLDDAQKDALEQALYRHGMILFRNVQLDEAQQLSLALRFGRERMIFFFMGASGTLACIVGFTASWPWLFVFLLMCVHYGCMLGDSGALTSGVIAATPPEQRGATIAVYSLSGFTAAFLAPLVFGVNYFLFHTRWGLRTRAIGEYPSAADTAGVNVIRMRLLNVMFAGAIAASVSNVLFGWLSDRSVARGGGCRGDLRLLAHEVQGLPWESEGLRVVCDAQFSITALRGAQETFEALRRTSPDDLHANFRLGTIYQKLATEGPVEQRDEWLTRSDQAIRRALDAAGPDRDRQAPDRLLRAANRRLADKRLHHATSKPHTATDTCRPCAGAPVPARHPSPRASACHAGGYAHQAAATRRILSCRRGGPGSRPAPRRGVARSRLARPLMRPRSSFAGAAIEVSDLDRSVAFHRLWLPMLGFHRVWASPDRVMWSRGYDHFVMRQAKDGAARGPGALWLAVSAESRAQVDQVYAELRDAGAEILQPPKELDYFAPGYYSMGFRDPDGVPIEGTLDAWPRAAEVTADEAQTATAP